MLCGTGSLWCHMLFSHMRTVTGVASVEVYLKEMCAVAAIRAEVSLFLQVVDLLRYFSWAEPQLKAMKALQHVSDSPSPACKVTMFHSPHFTQSRRNCGLYQKELTLIPLHFDTPNNYVKKLKPSRM